MKRLSFEEWRRTVKGFLFCRKGFHANDTYIDHLEKKNEILMDALEYINEAAPCMHEYNTLELKMVIKAREALEKIKEMG
jgi:hypothetical protein